MILSPILVLYVIVGECLPSEKEHHHPNDIMPKRPLSTVFAVKQTSENLVKDIFQDLQNIGITAHGVGCLQRVSNDRYCITYGKENYPNTF